MKHQSKFWLMAALAFGSAIIVGVIIAKTVPAASGVANPVLIIPMLLSLTVVLAITCWLWWQKTDDLQRQGQLISWWWGGSFGAVAGLIVIVGLTGRHSDISLGATYLFFAQFAGMAVVWVAWKLRGLGPTE